MGESGGSGGNTARKIRLSLESPQEKAARNSAQREMYGGDMSTQADTHRLNEVIFGVNPQAKALLVQMKVEIENFINAVHRASSLTQSLLTTLTYWRPTLSDIASTWYPTIPVASSANSILLRLCLSWACQLTTLATYSRTLPECLW